MYGAALAHTWAWLGGQGDLDFGPDRLPQPDDETAPTLRVAYRPPPVLLPSHLDRWAQTSPPPHADPDPDMWLHGIRESADLDVSVVWRGDLGELSAENQQVVIDWLFVCPPSAGEAMSVPISAVRKWLANGRGKADNPSELVADVEGAPMLAPDRRRRADPEGQRLAVRWRPGDESSVVTPSGIRPGDTIVVPASYGGIGAGKSWDPRSQTPVDDLATRSQRRPPGPACPPPRGRHRGRPPAAGRCWR